MVPGRQAGCAYFVSQVCLRLHPRRGDGRGGKRPLPRSNGFPDFRRRYVSDQLFPLFQNRVMAKRRPDFREYLEVRDIEEQDPDPLEILAVDGGYRVTDNFQVFPKIEKAPDGDFRCRFFLHGWRHTNDEAKRRLRV